jgi:gluconokinase
VAKMSAGVPLDDADRWPWLDAIGAALQGETGMIASCSALKRVYRERLAAAAGRPVRFVFLQGSKALLAGRIAARKGHFMPPSLLDSQFAALEPPAPDELAQAFEIDQPAERIVRQAAAYLTGKMPHA